jgi:Fic family protein
MSIENGGASRSPEQTPEDTELATLRESYLERLTRPGRPFQMAEAFPLPAELPALYAQLSKLKTCLDSFRPLDPAQAEKLQQAFDIEYTYNSNKIEGNTLSLRETDLVVNKGLTIAGKPLREHLEAINHHEAIAFIRDLVARKEELTPYNLKHIHALVLHGIDRDNAGVYRQVPVTITGSQHQPPQPFMIDKLMEDMFHFYEAYKTTLHPVQLAAEMHEKLVTIHPFIDGNGRTARLVMNLLLLRTGYPITVLSGDDAPRADYYRTLEAANLTNDNTRFQRFIADNARAALLRYLDLVSVDVSEHGKSKGLTFFQAIAPYLNGHSKP